MRQPIVVAAALLAALAVVPAARAAAPVGLARVRLPAATGASPSDRALVTAGVTAPAAHTATHGRRLHPRHHLRHGRIRGAVVDADAHGRLAHADGPGPGRPVHHGAEHRAAVPTAQPRPHSSPSGSRGGPAALSALPGLTSALPGPRVVPESRHSIAQPEGRTISGRGPPATDAAIATLLRPRLRSLPRPVAGPASETTPVTLESASTPRSPRPSPPAARPRPGRSVFREPVRDRSLDRRSEGATASFDPPSTGDAP